MARRRIQEWSGTRRIGRRIDPAAISSSAGIRPHEAQHTAGAPAEVRVEHVGIVPIGNAEPGGVSAWQAVDGASVVADGRHVLAAKRFMPGLSSDTCASASACVVTAIKKDFDVLSSSSASQAQKLASLKFLGHWVGDIHQPLHVSFEDDRGGNNVLVTGECGPNLHAAWDTCLVLKAVGEDVGAAATELMKTITPAGIESWTHSEPMDWANESFAIADHERALAGQYD